MTENTLKVIKIASGIAILVIAGVKVVMVKKNNKTEEPVTEEAAE